MTLNGRPHRDPGAGPLPRRLCNPPPVLRGGRETPLDLPACGQAPGKRTPPRGAQRKAGENARSQAQARGGQSSLRRTILSWCRGDTQKSREHQRERHCLGQKARGQLEGGRSGGGADRADSRGGRGGVCTNLLVPGLGLFCPLHARSGWELESKGVATMDWVGEGRCKDGCPQGRRQS